MDVGRHGSVLCSFCGFPFSGPAGQQQDIEGLPYCSSGFGGVLCQCGAPRGCGEPLEVSVSAFAPRLASPEALSGDAQMMLRQSAPAPMELSDDDELRLSSSLMPQPVAAPSSEDLRLSLEDMRLSQDVPSDMRLSGFADDMHLSGSQSLLFSDPQTRPGVGLSLFDSEGNMNMFIVDTATGGMPEQQLMDMSGDMHSDLHSPSIDDPHAPPDEQYDASTVRMMVPNAHGSGFACEWEECAQSFVSLSDLGAHIKNDHILEQKKQNRKLKMTGSRCYWKGCEREKEKPFNSFYNLEMHIRFLHTGEKPFACDFAGCALAFSQQSDLKAHKALHSDKDGRKGRPGSKDPSPKLGLRHAQHIGKDDE